MSGRRTWLQRNLVVLTAVSFLQDAASEFVYPLLPVLLTGAFAAPPVVVGVVEGVADAVAGLTRYLAGRASDRVGRRRFIGLGYGLAAVGKVVVAAAATWPGVLAGRVVDRVGKGVRSAPRDALIAASVPPEHRGRAFGFHRAGDTAGAVVGPLAALAALQVLSGEVRAVLWWAILPAVASVLLTLAVRERPVGPTPNAVPLVPSPEQASAPEGRLWAVIAVIVGCSLVNFSDALLLLRLTELGFGPAAVVASYLAVTVVYALGAYPAGALADRVSPAVLYAAGLVAFGVAYVGLGLVSSGPAAVALLALYGLFPACTDGVAKAWIASLVLPDRLGWAHGVSQGCTSGAVLVAGIWAGLLWSWGPGGGVVPLVVAGTVALAAAPALALARGRLTAPGPGRRCLGDSPP
jgi:MFS family permease